MSKSEKPLRSWQVWLVAARPRTLPLAAAPVCAGTALALAEGAAFDGPAALAALLAALLIQIGTNLHNDVADCLRGNDQPDRPGPLRVTAAGLASPRAVLQATGLVLLLALALGIYLVWLGGWPIFSIGIASLVAALAYSGGPRPLSYTPLGEVLVWLFFGVLAVVGSYWLQRSAVSGNVLLLGALTGLPAAAVLLVNNLRDRLADQRVGRRTLAVVLGDARSRHCYGWLMLLPFPGLLWLAASGHPGAALALLLLPVSLRLSRSLTQGLAGTELNGFLARTAQTAFLFSLLVSVGLLGGL